MAGHRAAPLPFVHAAFRYHLSCFPEVHTGLSSTEALALSLLSQESQSFRTLLGAVQTQQPVAGLSDLHLAALLHALCHGDTPLLDLDGPLPRYDRPAANPTLTLTPAGREVLSGHRDRLTTVGIDWWLGGVHLQSDR